MSTAGQLDTALHGRLELFLDRAFEWLAGELEWFNPARPSPFVHPVAAFSPLLELAHAVRVATGLLGADSSPGLRKLASAFEQSAEPFSRRLSEIRVAPASSFYLAWLQAELAVWQNHSRQRRLAPLGLDRALLPAGVFSDLEYIYVNSSLGFVDAKALDQRFDHWAQSSVYRGTVTAAQCYEFTHAVAYVGAFGARPVSLEVYERYRTTVRGLLQASTRQAQMDLSAELLLAWSVIREEPDRDFGRAWARLLSAQNSGGYLPGTFFSGKGEGSEETRHPDYAVAMCYHTTVAAALAAAAALN